MSFPSLFALADSKEAWVEDVWIFLIEGGRGMLLKTFQRLGGGLCGEISGVFL